MEVMASNTRIVVVGGGYVGMYTALRLQQKLHRGEADDHGDRPALEHDLPAVPARGGGRLDRAAPRGRPAAQGAAASCQDLTGRVTAINHAAPRGHRRAGRRPPGPSSATTCWSSPPARWPARCRSRGSPSAASPSRPSARRSTCATTCSSRLDAAATTLDPGAAPPAAHVPGGRRGLCRRRGARRAGRHGPLRHPLLREDRPRRHALGAGRGGRADHARGRSEDGRATRSSG